FEKKIKRKICDLIQDQAEEGTNRIYSFMEGYMRFFGIEFAVNLVEAKEMFTKAAQQGLAEAYFYLGIIEDGQNNIIEALEYYKKAARLGHFTARIEADILELDEIDEQFYSARNSLNSI